MLGYSASAWTHTAFIISLCWLYRYHSIWSYAMSKWISCYLTHFIAKKFLAFERHCENVYFYVRWHVSEIHKYIPFRVQSCSCLLFHRSTHLSCFAKNEYVAQTKKYESEVCEKDSVEFFPKTRCYVANIDRMSTNADTTVVVKF